MKKAIFLDRDGVLIETGGFISKSSQVVMIDGVKDALRQLKDKGFTLIVVTNQPVVARGLASEKEVAEINDFINRKLDGLIDRFYICPHHPEMHEDVPVHAKKYRVKCECRKPLPGMLLMAAEYFKLDLKDSWMIGDMVSDVAAGKAAGCKTIMIKSKHSEHITKTWPPFDSSLRADFNVSSLMETVELIPRP